MAVHAEGGGSALSPGPQDHSLPRSELAEHSWARSSFLSRKAVAGARRGWVKQTLRQPRLGMGVTTWGQALQPYLCLPCAQDTPEMPWAEASLGTLAC